MARTATVSRPADRRTTGPPAPPWRRRVRGREGSSWPSMRTVVDHALVRRGGGVACSRRKRCTIRRAEYRARSARRRRAGGHDQRAVLAVDRVVVKTHQQQFLDGRADLAVVLPLTAPLRSWPASNVTPKKYRETLPSGVRTTNPLGCAYCLLVGIVGVAKTHRVGEAADRRIVGAGEEMPAGIRAGAG